VCNGGVRDKAHTKEKESTNNTGGYKKQVSKAKRERDQVIANNGRHFSC